MSNRLKGKRALVTAAGLGMGRAAVLAFAREGATVIATDFDESRVADLAKVPGVTIARLDVTHDEEILALVQKTGAVDILFNCAGWVHQGSIIECRAEDWDK
ncbi:MAG TPA: SDR family oxidoreductase, partial [Usitatibacter sp.]